MLILGACLSMAIRDALMTLLTISESRGRAVLSGVLDAAGDIAGVAVMALGAGQIIVHGVTFGSCLVLAAMAGTSFLTTMTVTYYGRRVEASE